MLGAFASFLIVVNWHWPYWAAYLLIPWAIGLIAAAMESAILRPLRRADMFTVVIATVFLGIAISEGFRLTYNTELLAVPSLFAGPPLIVAGVLITRDTLWVIAGALAAALACIALFSYGRVGRGMRAMAANIRGAQLCGYSIDRVYMLAWFLGGGLAGLTGVLIAPVTGVSIDLSIAIITAGFVAGVIAAAPDCDAVYLPCPQWQAAQVVDELEREWRTIRGELDSVLARRNEITNVQGIIAGAASITRDAGWKIFVLVAQGVRSPPNIALCPQTWRLVPKIPGLRTAMFSIFEPGKRLPPHRGSYNGVLRLHLGLLVPEPPTSLGIRIGSELRHWREGAVLIFDDSQEHEAWNETNRPRVVLFVDFLKPLKFPADLLNRLLLGIALFTPYVREGRDNLRRWEKQFHDR